MKKLLFLVAIVSVISLYATNTVSAALPQQNERGSISVNSSANTEIAPDVAELSFAVVTTDSKSMQKATQENKTISDNLYSILSNMLTPANGDFIKTSNFTAQPIYSYSNSKKNFDKYEVSNRITVHTKSIDKLGAMIDKSISAGATNVDSLTFSSSNYETKCNDLLTIATKKAQSRANVIAKALSSSVDGVKSISVSCNANDYRHPRMYMTKNMLFDSAVGGNVEESTTTTINSGNVKIQANVNANFFVK